MSTEDTTKLDEARAYTDAMRRTNQEIGAHVIDAALDALAAENEKLRSAENLLAMNAHQMSRATAMSLDQAAVFIESIQRAAIDQRDVRAVRAERDALRAQLDGVAALVAWHAEGDFPRRHFEAHLALVNIRKIVEVTD